MNLGSRCQIVAIYLAIGLCCTVQQRLSSRDVYGGYYGKSTATALRHESRQVYGRLRELLGPYRFELNVSTPAQAFRLCLSIFRSTEQFILDSEDGVTYRMMVGRQHIGEDNGTDLGLPLGDREVFSIAPVIAGAGRTFSAIAIGVGLIGASFLFTGRLVWHNPDYSVQVLHSGIAQQSAQRCQPSVLA